MRTLRMAVVDSFATRFTTELSTGVVSEVPAFQSVASEVRHTNHPGTRSIVVTHEGRALLLRLVPQEGFELLCGNIFRVVGVVECELCGMVQTVSHCGIVRIVLVHIAIHLAVSKKKYKKVQ